MLPDEAEADSKNQDAHEQRSVAGDDLLECSTQIGDRGTVVNRIVRRALTEASTRHENAHENRENAEAHPRQESIFHTVPILADTAPPFVKPCRHSNPSNHKIQPETD